MPPSSNKYIQILDQGLSAFVFERVEGKPILSENPLLVAPWRDELEDYLAELNPKFSVLWRSGIIIDTKATGNIIFSTFQQATDYQQGTMPRDFEFKNPAPVKYVRSAAISAKYTISKTDDLEASTLPSKWTVSIDHIQEAAQELCTAICATISSRHMASRFKTKCKRDGLALLKQLDAHITKLLDDEAADAIEAAITAFVTRGLQSHSPSAFSDMADQIELWNKVQIGPRTLSESILSAKYMDIMRKELGPTPYSELKGDRKDAGSPGDLEVTRDTIVAFLTKDITTALKDGLQDAQSGKMHKFGDAVRPGEPSADGGNSGKQKRTPQEREAAGEAAPGKCPFPGCNKHHWFHNCPEAKAAKAKADKAAADEAKGKGKKAGQAKRLQDALDAAATAQAALKVANTKLAESDAQSSTGSIKKFGISDLDLAKLCAQDGTPFARPGAGTTMSAVRASTRRAVEPR